MTDSETSAVEPDSALEKNQAVNKKKRSPIERAIVWGVISVFLVVVLFEWNARYGYSNTLAEMQNRIGQVEKDNDSGKGTEFLLAEAKEMVKGFPIGEERVTNSGKKLQYRWFSLFRTYVIQLSISTDDVILFLQTDIEPFPDKKKLVKNSEIALHQLGLPKKGLSEEYDDVVVLTTDQLNSQDIKGILTREIVRQALLIGAREELGLKTRDASLRGDVSFIENPETFPLMLITPHFPDDFPRFGT